MIAAQPGSGPAARSPDQAERVRGLLRAVRYPGFERDIVAAGFVKDIKVDGKRVTVHFAPNTRDQAKVDQMEADIRRTLGGAGNGTADGEELFESVEIERHPPFPEFDRLSSGGMTPLQAEMLEDGVVPEDDLIGKAMQRPDMARQAGYNEDGPAPMGGPSGDTYDGALPVLQWEIDPHDPDAKSGTANLTIDDWEFRLWWQIHPSRLVYCSIQAMREDRVEHDGAARTHPVGRAAAVNLVYDTQRKAVVAIYGTVQDFRPFVDAFHRGYVLKN